MTERLTAFASTSVVVPRPPPPVPHIGLTLIDRVLGMVSTEFAVPVRFILGKGHFAEHVRARHAAMTILRHCGLSYPAIGRMLRKDHTTVMHGVRAMANHRERYRALDARLLRIESYFVGKS